VSFSKFYADPCRQLSAEESAGTVYSGSRVVRGYRASEDGGGEVSGVWLGSEGSVVQCNHSRMFEESYI